MEVDTWPCVLRKKIHTGLVLVTRIKLMPELTHEA